MDIAAVIVNLFCDLPDDQRTSLAYPLACVAQLRKQRPDSEQPHRFTDSVVVPLRQRVINEASDTFSVLLNHVREPADTVASRVWRIQERMQTKAPGHHTQGEFLPTGPVHT